jgi:anti-sigma factor RsiW
MNDPLYDRLRELGWRRELTAREEAEVHAWLAAHPEMRADWEAEAALNLALERLPDAPVPSNFTAQVLSRIDGMKPETAGSSGRGSEWRWLWHSLLPKAAVAAVALVVGLFSYEEHRAVQRAELARNVAVISGFAATQNPEALMDFDAIRRLGQTAPADEELLALLK